VFVLANVKKTGGKKMSKTSSLSVNSARPKLGGLADRCMIGGESFVLTKHSKPVCKIVPMQGQDLSGDEIAPAKPKPKRFLNGDKKHV